MNEQQDEEEIMTGKDGTVFVGGSTNTKDLAVCICSMATREGRKEAKMRGIGAGAVGQMTKAYIIAKGRLMVKGIITKVDMAFTDVKGRDGKTISGIEYTINFT